MAVVNYICKDRSGHCQSDRTETQRTRNDLRGSSKA